MSWKFDLRSSLDEPKRQREAQKHARDLERRNKERARLTSLEQARLDVETFENQLDLLLSIHEDQTEPRNWTAVSVSLPPIEPKRYEHAELRARQNDVLATVRLDSSLRQPPAVSTIEARARDDEAFKKALDDYAVQASDWKERRALSRRILAADQAAFQEVLDEMNPLAEIPDLCVDVDFTVHSTKLVECALYVKGTGIIPKEARTLTASGKLSVKPMAKARFHEIYQDYVCGSVLRAAREVVALLPVEVVLVTASVPILNTATGHEAQGPVLSAVIPRSALSDMDWGDIDPSDAMELFLRRGDVKASRKTGSFVAIVPFVANEVPLPTASDTSSLAATLAAARALTDQIKAQGEDIRSRIERNT